MAEYTKIETARAIICDFCNQLYSDEPCEPADCDWLRMLEEDADVAPVMHGHWVVRFDGPYKRRRCYCSHCGKHNGVGGIAQNQEKPYCPNCGARMDGDDDAKAD